jgi:hypothetical protein
MHSFEIWLTTTVVFFGLGNVGYMLLEYRLGEKDLVQSLWENVRWIPFLQVFSPFCVCSTAWGWKELTRQHKHSVLFFGSLAIPVSQAILVPLIMRGQPSK